MKIGIGMKEIATGVEDAETVTEKIGTEVGFPLKPLAEAIETIQNRLKEIRMPEYGEERGRGEEREERRGDRDRDRDRWDVKPERPSKNTMEAAEDVEGLMKVAWDVAKDVAKERADSHLLIATYDWILKAREI